MLLKHTLHSRLVALRVAKAPPGADATFGWLDPDRDHFTFEEVLINHPSATWTQAARVGATAGRAGAEAEEVAEEGGGGGGAAEETADGGGSGGAAAGLHLSDAADPAAAVR